MKNQTYIIAEAGVNHNSSLNLAFKLVDAAVEAGADAVKFQTFKAENLVVKSAQKAAYQRVTTNVKESQFQMLKKLELTKEMHFQLVKYCKNKNIDFMSTPFDIESLSFLSNELKIDVLKIPSGEITNAPFLLEVGRRRKKIILSTGMSSLGEIEQALSILAFGLMNDSIVPSNLNFLEAYYSAEGQRLLKDYVTLLHCTTEYPTPNDEVNLNVMDTLNQAFQLPVGLSDHTKGIAIPIAAVARNAVIIEKHFTLDRAMDGPDHKASLEPIELKEMVESIRNVEKALGSYLKHATKAEQKNINLIRKSLVASKSILPGEQFTTENLSVKRPGTGVSPTKYWEYIGRKAEKRYQKDDIINE